MILSHLSNKKYEENHAFPRGFFNEIYSNEKVKNLQITPDI